MKKIFNSTFLHKTLGISLCFTALSCLCVTNVYAQDEMEEEEVAVKKTAKPKKEKTYEMKEVTGYVTDDATGEPMGGVRIQALGLEKYSTLTDTLGYYKLSIPVFSNALYVYAEGYNPLQVVVKNGQADANLITVNFNGSFNEGTSIISEKTAIIDESSSISVDQDIERLLAGDVRAVLRSGLPGIGNYMTIRGVNSINGNAQPLIILDGNMIDPQYNRETMHQGFYNNLLAGIDPENIESVQVIKNGTALYGAKGGNGVIIINTKRGKSMATKISARIYGGVELTPKTLSVLSGDQYNTYLSDMASTIKDMTASNLKQFAFLDKSPSNYYRKVFSNNTDWQKGMYQNAMTQNYKINVEGGDEVGMYVLSLGYTTGKSTGKGTDFDRLNLRFNTDIQVFERVRTALDIAYNQVSYDILDNGWSEDYTMQNIGSTNVLGLIQAPFISPYSYYYDENSTALYSSDRLALSQEFAGKYASNDYANLLLNPFKFPLSLDTKNGGINEALRNPYWILQNGGGQNKNYAQNTQIDLNVCPKWEVTKTFSISNRFNFLLTRNSERYFLPVNGATQYFLKDLGNIYSVQKTLFSKETTLQNDLRLDWRNIYGAHTVNVFGGWRYNNYSYSYNYMRGYNNENDKLPKLDKSMDYPDYGGTNDSWKDITLYLDANYNYANRYFVDATLSLQSSSRFGKHTNQGIRMFGVSWGVFPSLQLGWIISNENWFPSVKGVNYLKLTAGYDKSGNDDLDYYAARTYWESMKVTNNTVGLYLNNIENSSIQWETTTKWNVALQGAFLNNRLTAGIDLFWNKTKNLLTLRELHYMSGMKKYWTNEGALVNRGFEFHTNAAIINKKNWKWELGATIGHYNNKVTALPEGSSNYIQLSDINGGNIESIHGYTTDVYGSANILTAVGLPVGSFYGWRTNGVFANDLEASTASVYGYLKYDTGRKDLTLKYENFKAGDVRFVDKNGDGVINDADKYVIGNPNPDIYGNIYSSLTWKNLRLDVNFKYSLGNDIYNYQRSVVEGLNTTYNQTTAALRRWTHENQYTDMPKACYTNSDDWRNNERMSDRWIEDGSYLKLKNVRLTYKVPYSNSWLLGLKFWGEANNLFTVTKYLGTDPEMSCRNSVLYQGVDAGLISSGRSFNFGVSINL